MPGRLQAIDSFDRKAEATMYVDPSTKVHSPCNIYGNYYIGAGGSIGMFTEICDAMIGDRVRIQAHCFIPSGIIIGNDCFIGPRVTFTNVNKPHPFHANPYEETVVCDNVVIGAGAIILPGLRLGRNSFVAAGSVVTCDVLENAMVAGNPAKQIGSSPNKDC